MPERILKKCRLPLELHYDVTNHVWVRAEADGLYTLGITDVGQTLAGKLLYCDPKPVGTALALGRATALIESGKSIWPVRCPVPGEVAEINAQAASAPDTVNRDPYGEGWIVRVRAEGGAAGLARGMARLVTGEALLEQYLFVMEDLGFGGCIPYPEP
jgi:glycine cleavage system H protein